MNGFGAAGVAINSTQDSITAKATRVLSMVRDVEAAAERTLGYVLPPTPEKALGGVPSPEPSHLMFILEEAEQRLTKVSSLLQSTARALAG